MRRYSSRCSLLQSWLWDGREAQGISGWGFVQAEIQMDMLTMCSPLHDIITHYIVWDAVWHYCLAKELARRKSSTMSPAVCMRACVPAWVVWHLMLREIKPLGCPFVYHLGIGSSCAFWLFCKGTPPPSNKSRDFSTELLLFIFWISMIRSRTTSVTASSSLAFPAKFAGG